VLSNKPELLPKQYTLLQLFGLTARDVEEAIYVVTKKK
jgi:hypothetical protein